MGTMPFVVGITVLIAGMGYWAYNVHRLRLHYILTFLCLYLGILLVFMLLTPYKVDFLSQKWQGALYLGFFFAFVFSIMIPNHRPHSESEKGHQQVERFTAFASAGLGFIILITVMVAMLMRLHG